MSDKYLGESIGKLGFGFMRLPRTDKGVDYTPMIELVDVFLDNGFSYFDASYIYEGAEESLREAVVKRHPRDKYHIATKLPPFMLKNPEDMQRIFNGSLQRLGFDYVDFYPLHGLSMQSKDRRVTRRMGLS